MDCTLIPSDANVVRHLIARGFLGSSAAACRMGSVLLHDHQTSAVARLHSAIAEFGGALLSDAVGLGKTFVALAVARGYERGVVVAPAALRQMWNEAMAQADVTMRFVSIESLSRRECTLHGHSLVVVDEAHYARNPNTRRYTALSSLCRHAHVLLVSATPIHNHPRELAALLALFMGSAGTSLSAGELARVIVRRTTVGAGAATRLPAVRPTVWLRTGPDLLDEEESLARALMALPPPVPPSDGGDAAQLVAHALLRQAASSDAALAGAVKRRIARAESLGIALRSGRYPSASELRAWTFEEDSLQLAFPELVAVRTVANSIDSAMLERTLAEHTAALRTILRSLAAASRRDDARAAALMGVRRAHPDEKIVAFSQFGDTVRALYRAMRGAGNTAALTASGGLVAGGRITRRDAIARFAPRASGAIPPTAAHDITLLITTDLLSEGVNLQDASVVVHLDVPWTPARLEQRVGRVARLGCARATVSVYAIAPPPCLERALKSLATLRRKAAHMATTVGLRAPGNPDRQGRTATVPRSVPERVEALRALLGGWLCTPANSDQCALEKVPALAPCREIPVATVHTDRWGFLALCSSDGAPTLVASMSAARQPEDAAGANGSADAVTQADPVMRRDAWMRPASAATFAATFAATTELGTLLAAACAANPPGLPMQNDPGPRGSSLDPGQLSALSAALDSLLAFNRATLATAATSAPVAAPDHSRSGNRRRALLRRIAAATRAAPVTQRLSVARLAGLATATLNQRNSVSIEQSFDTLGDAVACDGELLGWLASRSNLQTPQSAELAREDASFAVRAILLLSPHPD